MTPEEAIAALKAAGPEWGWAIYAAYHAGIAPRFHLMGMRGFPVRCEVSLVGRTDLATAVAEAFAQVKALEWDPYSPAEAA